MKILVTNNTLGNLGGSETYAYALIKELNKRSDIEVEAFSQNNGLVAKYLIKEGIKVLTKVDKEYDVIIASHTSTIPHIIKNNGFKIQTCHGIFPPLEQPRPGLDAYVSISQEVKNHLTKLNYNSTIIHNGIDCDRFSPINKINNEVKTILSLAQSDYLNQILTKICNRLAIKLICLNKFKNPIFNVEDVINSADMVISLGRGAYESMACGRNVLVLDKRPYINKPPLGDGLITDKNIDQIILNNCSGRYSNVVFNDKMIEEEILKYDPSNGDFSREYALSNLNIITQVDKYLNLVK
jgi:glycosyltransferase involved in cell wall biosynthesis